MDIRELLAALWRQRVLVVLVLVVELAATFGFLATAPRVYEATATLAASPTAEALRSTGNFDVLEATFARLATTSDVLEGARTRLGGDITLGTLRESVRGVLVPNTVLIRVTAESSSARRAAEIANAVVTELPFHDPSRGLFRFTVAETARTPEFPARPNKRLVVGLGAVFGVALSVGAGLLRDNAARRVETADDVQESAGIAVLTRLPRPRDPSSIATPDSDSRAAASFRALRIALEFVAAREPLPALVVTSAVPDETEGWVAANLAVALAQVQHRVLLVDGNLASPRTHPALAAPDRPGLAEVLAGEAMGPMLVRGAIENLELLPAGKAPDHVAELVETRFGGLLLAWSREYDVVVVDAPAVTVSDDARVMAVAGAVLLTVPAGRAAPRTMREVAASLRAVNARVAGAVLLGTEGLR